MLPQVVVFFCFTLLPYCSAEYTPTVELTHGKIRGQVETFRETRVYDFLGIPYAQAPVDSLRFLKPIEPIPWTGVMNTTQYGKSCLQPTDGIMSPTKPEDTSEDCLFVNVFVNEVTFKERDTVKKPVLFWIHGGGFATGSGNERDAFRGTVLAALEDVVVVTINYRLNIFGFLYPGELVPEIPGNMGLWDQNFALKWTKKHISLFGGDPDAITIFGESAGSMAVGAHILSPESRGLFVGGIMESGGMRPSKESLSISSQASSQVLMRAGCLDAEDILACIQQVDAKLLPKLGIGGIPPIFGDQFLPHLSITEETVNPVNLMVGAEKDEGSLFTFGRIQSIDFAKLTIEEARRLLRETVFPNMEGDSLIDHYLEPGRNITPDEIRTAFLDASSDSFLICSTYQFGNQIASVLPSGFNVYGYFHTQRPTTSLIDICTEKPAMGVCHTDEIPFVFGIPLLKPSNYSREDLELSLRMMHIWAEFARTGSPPKQGSTRWHAFQESGPNDISVMELNSKYVGRIERDRPTFCIENSSLLMRGP